MHTRNLDTTVVQELQDYAHATHNLVASCSVATALCQFYKIYFGDKLNPEECLKIQFNQCMEEIKANTAKEYLAAYKYLKAKAKEAPNELDRVTLYGQEEPWFFPLKHVITLVWMALTDDKAYAMHLSPDEANEAGLEKHRKNRLLSFYNCIEALRTKNLCNHGTRNELVFILNKSYPCIELLEDAKATILNFYKETLAHFFTKAYATANEELGTKLFQAALVWITKDNPEGLIALVDEQDTLAKTLTDLFISHGADPKAIKLNEKIAEMLPYLPFDCDKVSHESLYFIKMLFKDFTEDQEANGVLSKVQAFVQQKFELHNCNHNAGLKFFCSQYQAYQVLKKHKYLLTITGYLTPGLETYEGLLMAYFRDRVIEAQELQLAIYPNLTKAYDFMVSYQSICLENIRKALKDNLCDVIENFFVHWYDAIKSEQRSEEVKAYKLLESESLQKAVFLTDEAIDQIMASEKEGELHLSVYLINRVLLHAIINPVNLWTEGFGATLFPKVLDFIKSHFNQSTTLTTTALYKNSYPQGLLNQLDYLYQSYLYMNDTELKAAPKRPNDMILLPAQIKTTEEWKRLVPFLRAISAEKFKSCYLTNRIDRILKRDLDTFEMNPINGDSFRCFYVDIIYCIPSDAFLQFMQQYFRERFLTYSLSEGGLSLILKTHKFTIDKVMFAIAQNSNIMNCIDGNKDIQPFLMEMDDASSIQSLQFLLKHGQKQEIIIKVLGDYGVSLATIKPDSTEKLLAVLERIIDSRNCYKDLADNLELLQNYIQTKEDWLKYIKVFTETETFNLPIDFLTDLGNHTSGHLLMAALAVLFKNADLIKFLPYLKTTQGRNYKKMPGITFFFKNIETSDLALLIQDKYLAKVMLSLLTEGEQWDLIAKMQFLCSTEHFVDIVHLLKEDWTGTEKIDILKVLIWDEAAAPFGIFEILAYIKKHPQNIHLLLKTFSEDIVLKLKDIKTLDNFLRGLSDLENANTIFYTLAEITDYYLLKIAKSRSQLYQLLGLSPSDVLAQLKAMIVSYKKDVPTKYPCINGSEDVIPFLNNIGRLYIEPTVSLIDDIRSKNDNPWELITWITLFFPEIDLYEFIKLVNMTSVGKALFAEYEVLSKITFTTNIQRLGSDINLLLKALCLIPNTTSPIQAKDDWCQFINLFRNNSRSLQVELLPIYSILYVRNPYFWESIKKKLTNGFQFMAVLATYYPDFDLLKIYPLLKASYGQDIHYGIGDPFLFKEEIENADLEALHQDFELVKAIFSLLYEEEKIALAIQLGCIAKDFEKILNLGELFGPKYFLEFIGKMETKKPNIFKNNLQALFSNTTMSYIYKATILINSFPKNEWLDLFSIVPDNIQIALLKYFGSEIIARIKKLEDLDKMLSQLSSDEALTELFGGYRGIIGIIIGYRIILCNKILSIPYPPDIKSDFKATILSKKEFNLERFLVDFSAIQRAQDLIPFLKNCGKIFIEPTKERLELVGRNIHNPYQLLTAMTLFFPLIDPMDYIFAAKKTFIGIDLRAKLNLFDKSTADGSVNEEAKLAVERLFAFQNIVSHHGSAFFNNIDSRNLINIDQKDFEDQPGF